MNFKPEYYCWLQHSTGQRSSTNQHHHGNEGLNEHLTSLQQHHSLCRISHISHKRRHYSNNSEQPKPQPRDTEVCPFCKPHKSISQIMVLGPEIFDFIEPIAMNKATTK